MRAVRPDLPLPPVPGAIAVLGSGYAAALLRHLPWLNDVDLCHWGANNTHGFAIRDQIQGRVPHTTSLLMDRATPPRPRVPPAAEDTDTPHPEEARLDQDRGYRPHLRLEQERTPSPRCERHLRGTGPDTQGSRHRTADARTVAGATPASDRPNSPRSPALQPPPLPVSQPRVAAKLDEHARIFVTRQHRPAARRSTATDTWKAEPIRSFEFLSSHAMQRLREHQPRPELADACVACTIGHDPGHR
ncbi:Wadjet anti-phage system protein JetD domain-containing protein [Streptomyces cadmiisoli]|uniref:Wadjet anti-phage system protein JetD domain-containing protein n=1 Tax=Streptomyces cadmiisoli TaxID=2184053 RepID=UPI0013A6FE9A